MKIGIFTDTYYPEINGVANSAYQLKQGLEKVGHTVYVFTVTNPNVIEEEKNVYRLPSVPFLFLKERRIGCSLAGLWINTVEKLNLDLIHTQTEFSIGHMGRRLANYLEIPFLHTYHTIYEDYTHYLKKSGNEQLKKVIRTFSKNCCNKADCIIAPTEKVRELLLSYGVDRDIIIQPTGVDAAKFENPEEEKVSLLKEKYGLKKSDHILMSIGRLSQEKNITELLARMSELVKVDKQAKLLIVGDGPEKKNLQEMTVQLEIADSVLFTGDVSWEEIEYYYALGDVFVCASTSESQGLTYLEALASGKPLLVRNDKCLKGILQEDVNGYGYDTKEEFIQRYSQLFYQHYYKKIAQETKQSIQNLTVGEFTRKMEQIYEGMLPKRGYVYGQVHQLVG